MGAAGRLMISRSLNRHSLNFYRPTTGRRNLLRAFAQTSENFRRNSLERGNLNLLAPHFLLFQRRLSAPYSLASRAVAGLAPPLIPAPVVTRFSQIMTQCHYGNLIQAFQDKVVPLSSKDERTYRPYAVPKRRIPIVLSPSVTSPNGILGYIAAKNSKPVSTAIFIKHRGV